MKYYVASVAVSGASELIESYGQDPLLIANLSGIPREALFSTDLEVSGSSVCDFYENAARACNTRFFGLEMAQRQGMQILGPIWMLMRNASTIGEALSSMAKNFTLHTDVTAFSLESELGGMTLCYEIMDETLKFESQVIEHGLGLTCMEISVLLGHHWTPEFAQFRYAAPYNLEPLKKVFGSNISFNQDRHAIHISAQDLAKPINTSDAEHYQVIQRKLNSRHEASGPQVVMQTKMAMRALMPEEGCHLDRIACAIGVSPRTLQRHLKSTGLSFQELKDQVRLDLAKKYLRHSHLSTGEIAERLHFSETAAFTRFFKRLEGTTPRQFLKQQP